MTEASAKSSHSVSLKDLRISATSGSFSPTLGEYYLDMTSVIPLVESGFHGGFDGVGVPVGNIDHGGVIYNVTTIAQYALALHDAYLQGQLTSTYKFTVQLKAIIRQIESTGEWRGFFLHRWKDLKYGRLRTPWVSGLAQGTAISALLRGYQVLGERSLLEEATAAFRALDRVVEAGGVRAIDECGHLWFEEYPLTPHIHVLNGFIFALWGVLDFARATADEKAWHWWEEGVKTLKAHVRGFDCGFWSLYDLRYRELASVHYHTQIHSPQLEAMYALTGAKIFREQAEQWRKTARSWKCRARWWLGLRLGAIQRRGRFD